MSEELPTTVDYTLTGEHVTLHLTDHSSEYLRSLPLGHRHGYTRTAVAEALHDFEALHSASERGVGGGTFARFDGSLAESQETYDDTELIISGQEVMQAWEKRLMAAMAEVATRDHGDVLEFGFGMGISATAMLEQGVRSYTVIDCNPDVLKRAHEWREQHQDQDIRIVEGRWQDVAEGLGRFDGIFFDTYPTTEEELEEVVTKGPLAIESVLPTAAAHLKPGGVLTYFTAEIDSLSRQHQRLLFEYFDRIELSVVRDLQPPADCSYWWADSMAVVAASTNA